VLFFTYFSNFTFRAIFFLPVLLILLDELEYFICIFLALIFTENWRRN
jgi:hypothetical protein